MTWCLDETVTYDFKSFTLVWSLYGRDCNLWELNYRLQWFGMVPVLKHRIGDSLNVKERLILQCCNADIKKMELNRLSRLSYAIMILFVLTFVVGQNCCLKFISELVFSLYISYLISDTMKVYCSQVLNSKIWSVRARIASLLDPQCWWEALALTLYLMLCVKETKRNVW